MVYMLFGQSNMQRLISFYTSQEGIEYTIVEE
jgi:hypothetical protein